MRAPSEREALRLAVELLADLVGADAAEVDVHVEVRDLLVDAIARLGRFTFWLEWAGSGKTAAVSQAVRHLDAACNGGEAIPIVAVPFMGEVGRRLCEEAGVAWLDLSGNARIDAEGLRVVVSGQPNRYKPRGRPASAFAPKSARIARWLLMHPEQPSTQAEIAEATDMDRGFTSRIVSRLLEDGLVRRDDDGRLSVPDRALLLDAWQEAYDFSRHEILRGHVAARSGDGLLRKLVAELQEREVDHAATGLAAAWALTKFAAFRLVSLYLPVRPSADLLSALGFREEERGANVWLVLPDDQGVLHGAREHDGIRCVHPVQAYLDLASHPERAKEAAAQLRKVLLERRDR